eukprot:g5585.t1
MLQAKKKSTFVEFSLVQKIHDDGCILYSLLLARQPKLTLSEPFEYKVLDKQGDSRQLWRNPDAPTHKNGVWAKGLVYCELCWQCTHEMGPKCPVWKQIEYPSGTGFG